MLSTTHVVGDPDLKAELLPALTPARLYARKVERGDGLVEQHRLSQPRAHMSWHLLRSRHGNDRYDQENSKCTSQEPCGPARPVSAVGENRWKLKGWRLKPHCMMREHSEHRRRDRLGAVPSMGGSERLRSRHQNPHLVSPPFLNASSLALQWRTAPRFDLFTIPVEHSVGKTREREHSPILRRVFRGSPRDTIRTRYIVPFQYGTGSPVPSCTGTYRYRTYCKVRRS